MFRKLSLLFAALIFSVTVLAAKEAGFTLRSYSVADGETGGSDAR